MLQYTGGTTGLAKGAMLTHGNLVANMLQVLACLGSARPRWQHPAAEGQEVMIAPLPLYHIYAFTANCMCMMVTGNHNVLITNPRDIPGFIKELGKWRFSALLGLNTLLWRIDGPPGFRQLDFSALKVTNSGGTALVKATAERWRSAYRVSHCRRLRPDRNLAGGQHQPLWPAARLGTVGIPVAGTAFKVIDDDGNELPLGERGELCIKGPQVMKGYWQKP
ncbi:AMP-binding protein [Pseudomonas peli]|uniref:AMP-binding protein n=1 Tax=Pseudomonas peli TaxID=592361 RepID=UPI0031F710AC